MEEWATILKLSHFGLHYAVSQDFDLVRAFLVESYRSGVALVAANRSRT